MYLHLFTSLESERKQIRIGQPTSGSCGLKLHCDLRCSPLTVMFRDLNRKFEARLSWAVENRDALLNALLSFLRKMACVCIA